MGQCSRHTQDGSDTMRQFAMPTGNTDKFMATLWPHCRPINNVQSNLIWSYTQGGPTLKEKHIRVIHIKSHNLCDSIWNLFAATFGGCAGDLCLCSRSRSSSSKTQNKVPLTHFVGSPTATTTTTTTTTTSWIKLIRPVVANGRGMQSFC